jgi:heat shock protein HslJ
MRTGWTAAVIAVLALGTPLPVVANGTAPQLPPDVIGATWEWSWFGSGKEAFSIDEPERYTIQFMPDGMIAVQADCNRAMAEYTLEEVRRISFSPLAMTRMLCPEGSKDDFFAGMLGRIQSYFEMDGDFFLEVPLDSGTLRFRRME